MRVLIFHGYLLRGTGSNEYNAALGEAFARNGHEVAMVSQDRAPFELPWSVENLRFCNWCDQLAQIDLNDCPSCGRRMAPIGAS